MSATTAGSTCCGVSKATVYRHTDVLAAAGILETVGERRVRGAVERRYRLRQEQASVSQATFESASREDHRRAFAAATAALLAEFNAYLDHDDADPAADLVGQPGHTRPHPVPAQPDPVPGREALPRPARVAGLGWPCASRHDAQRDGPAGQAPAAGQLIGRRMMRVLVVGAGGVGSAVARTVARWNLFERVVVADYDEGRARRAIAGGGDRFAAFQLDARDEQAIAGLIRAERCDAVLNAVDPRFVMPIFRAALAAGVTYLDMAMSLSRPHASDPYRQPGVKLGDEQFALAGEWERRGLLALCGIGVEPGLSDVFARYAADRLFASDRRDRASATARTWWSRATTSPRRSPSGRRSRSA